MFVQGLSEKLEVIYKPGHNLNILWVQWIKKQIDVKSYICVLFCFLYQESPTNHELVSYQLDRKNKDILLIQGTGHPRPFPSNLKKKKNQNRKCFKIALKYSTSEDCRN